MYPLTAIPIAVAIAGKDHIRHPVAEHTAVDLPNAIVVQKEVAPGKKEQPIEISTVPT